MQFFIFLLAALVSGVTVLSLIRKHYDKKVNAVWKALQIQNESGEVFSQEMAEGLPMPAKQWLLHAIEPGRQLARRVEITLTGAIKLGDKGRWIPFEAIQIIAAGKGFVWKAKVRISCFVNLEGADYYFNREGRVHFSLFGLIPAVNVSGTAAAKSAAGRVLLESCLLPTAFLPHRGAKWEGIDSLHARAILSVDELSAAITMTYNQDGSLKELVMPRHRGNENGNTAPFGAAVGEEKNFEGFTIPSKLSAGWWYGTDKYREFFRAEIRTARFY